MKKSTLCLLAFAMLLFAGCGYKFGSLAHPQLQSIAIAPVTNDTLAYNAAAVLRGMLTERVTTDGSLKLKSQTKADCILYARVADVKYSAIDFGTTALGDDTYLANEWKCSVTVEFSVVIPGRGAPLIANRMVTGTSKFITGPDLETSRISGMRQALFDASKQIISGVVEGW